MSRMGMRQARTAPRSRRAVLEILETRSLLSTLLVTNTSDSGAGSLREALRLTIASAGDDTIAFELDPADPNFDPTTATWKIAIDSPLSVDPSPNGTNAVNVDATTQPQYASLQRPLVQITPSAAFTGDAGIVIDSAGSALRGLVINRFPVDGVQVRAPDTQLTANYIGTNVLGTAALGNGRDGVFVGSSNNTVGATAASPGNLISGNVRDGIRLANAANNLIFGNKIGTDVGGTSGLENGTGVEVVALDRGRDNRIGGNDASQSNVIAFNSVGVAIDASVGNAILVNSTFANKTGIVLRNGGNRDQSAPTISEALRRFDGTGTFVTFSLTSTPSSTFDILFFANPAGTANPQGQTFAGRARVTTDSNGAVSTSVTLPEALPAGTLVTATATNAQTGDSSPFSGAKAVVDEPDPFVVINTNDSGRGSLRQVILNANAAPGFNVVRFAIPGGGVHTIVPLSPLPAVVDPASVDATTQPGYAGTPLVAVNGSATSGDGLIVRAGGSSVKGLVVQGFSEAGVHFLGAADGIVQANYVGTDAAGRLSRPNAIGLLVEDSPNMTIGGTQAGQANTISGNLTAGVYLAGSKTTGAIITGNFLGTDPTGSQRVIRGDGSSPLADLQKTGVVVVDAGANTIGPLNVVSGNYVGVMLAGAGQTTVTSNRIGVAADGNSPLGNIVGIYINRSSNNTVVRNTISANTQTGVEIFGASTGNVVAGNIIGLGADGRTPLRTGGAFIQQTGVFVLDASGNTIGGSSAAAANTISGNAQSGVFIQSRNARARNNLLARNLIGPVTGGTTGPGNGLYGVVLYNAPENRVVQTGPDANRFFRNPGGNVRDFRGPNAAGAMAIARVRTRRTARR